VPPNPPPQDTEERRREMLMKASDGLGWAVVPKATLRTLLAREQELEDQLAVVTDERDGVALLLADMQTRAEQAEARLRDAEGALEERRRLVKSVLSVRYELAPDVRLELERAEKALAATRTEQDGHGD
jgi:chromosome segregation ATPase